MSEGVEQCFLEGLLEPIICNLFKLVVSSSTLTVVLALISRSVWSVVLRVLVSYLRFKRSQIFHHTQCFHTERMELKLYCSDIFISLFYISVPLHSCRLFSVLLITGQTVTTLFSRS